MSTSTNTSTPGPTPEDLATARVEVEAVAEYLGEVWAALDGPARRRPVLHLGSEVLDLDAARETVLLAGMRARFAARRLAGEPDHFEPRADPTLPPFGWEPDPSGYGCRVGAAVAEFAARMWADGGEPGHALRLLVEADGDGDGGEGGGR